MSFVSDTFTESGSVFLEDHVGEVGASWSAHPAGTVHGAVVDGNGLHENSGTALYYASGLPASADYDVRADLVGAASGDSGVVGRLDVSAATFYLARWSAGNWDLYKCVAGSFTALGSYAQSLTGGVTYADTLSMSGSSIALLVDGTQRVGVTDSAVTAAGRPGVRLVAVDVRVDYLSATDTGNFTALGGSFPLRRTYRPRPFAPGLAR